MEKPNVHGASRHMLHQHHVDRVAVGLGLERGDLVLVEQHPVHHGHGALARVALDRVSAALHVLQALEEEEVNVERAAECARCCQRLALLVVGELHRGLVERGGDGVRDAHARKQILERLDPRHCRGLEHGKPRFSFAAGLNAPLARLRARGRLGPNLSARAGRLAPALGSARSPEALPCPQHNHPHRRDGVRVADGEGPVEVHVRRGEAEQAGHGRAKQHKQPHVLRALGRPHNGGAEARPEEGAGHAHVGCVHDQVRKRHHGEEQDQPEAARDDEDPDKHPLGRRRRAVGERCRQRHFDDQQQHVRSAVRARVQLGRRRDPVNVHAGDGQRRPDEERQQQQHHDRNRDVQRSVAFDASASPPHPLVAA
mmetsp:Transcript_16738/g.63385  ORF Transcript_16738/g.63385 Transcript_16738/m.63385 type:complete len:370 (-) Transcript_16738:500-1609(-)